MLAIIGFVLVAIIITLITLIIIKLVTENTNFNIARRRPNLKVVQNPSSKDDKVISHPNSKEVEQHVVHASYKEISGNGFLNTYFNKGNYGEYLTYTELTRMKGYHRVLTNLYLPSRAGKKTELDLVMISQKGIYVFESKNYSGWIFGDEKNKNWMQILPGSKKYPFFNPIWQNNGHINLLKAVVGDEIEPIYYSYIIFSERCKLKKMTVTSSNVTVIKRDNLIPTIRKHMQQVEDILSTDQVDQLYITLKQFSLADNETKQEHILQINEVRK